MDEEKDTLYARWLSGNISDEEKAELQRTGALEDLERLVADMDNVSFPPYAIDAGFAKLKANRSTGKAAILRTMRPKRQRAWLAAAASILFLVGTFYFWGNQVDTVKADLGQTLAHTFLDSSTVILNDGSQISYDKGKWSENRAIQLVGEAVFQVEKGRPFMVQTALGSVEVLGTKFNVRAWNERLEITCFEGKVRVTQNNRSAELGAGEAVVGSRGQFSKKQIIDHQEPFWTVGLSKFSAVPFDQVLEELRRQYAVQIESPTINRPFNGSFRHDDLATAVQAVCKPMNLKYTISEDGKSVNIAEPF
ncbi:MAG: FecR domain-containing protein [Bacteroidota bacterium]